MTKQEAWEIIDNNGGPSAVATMLHVSVAAVLGWIERGDIPHRHLLALEAAQMTAEQMLRKLVTEIDRNCIRTGRDGDKVLVALDQSLLDQAWSVAHQQENKPG